MKPIFAVLTSLWFGGVAQAATVDRIAALVNDEVVTLSEVYELGRAFIDERSRGGTEQDRRDAEAEVLDSLIRRRLMTQVMMELQIDATDMEVDRSIDDISRRNGMEREVLRAEVERGGLSWGQYRDEIREVVREQKFTQMIIRPRIVENEDEIRDAYRRLVNGSDQPVRVDLGAIFVPYPSGADDRVKKATMAKIRSARMRVEAGETFAAVAAEVDQGPYGANGGSMGTYLEGELVDSLNEPAFSTAEGELSDPIVTAQGIFLLKVRKREKVPLRSYEETRDELAAQVNQGRIEREKDVWYQQARREASVEIKLETSSEK
ncbi:MAG: peptidylprolyl isomerase [Myxococcota bacterium]